MLPVTPSDIQGALRKSAVAWLTPDGHPTRLVWAVYAPRGGPPGTLLVACGGDEQQVPGLVDGARVSVVLARPGTRSALCTLRCTASVLAAPDPAVVTALVAARRNAAARWDAVVALDLLAALAPTGGG